MKTAQKMWSVFMYVPRRLFPSPRRPVTRWAVWPLVFFLTIFTGTVLLLEYNQVLRFAAPWAFIWVLVLPWVWWLSAAGWGGLAGMRAHVALLVRLSLLGLFIMLLAEPRAVRTSNDLCVVYCLDSSDSIGEHASEQVQQWMLQTVGEKPKLDQAGLVIFGRDAAVELPPSQSFPFQAFTTRIGHDGTDLEKALALSAAVLPEDRPGRIVLVSDGVATSGNLERALDQLTRRGIAVDVLPVQYDHQHEVWVEKIDLPREARPGETYEAGVVVNSLQSGHGALVLRENGKEIARQVVNYRGGKNRFTLPLYLRGSGYYEYAATIEPGVNLDGLRENNTAIGYLYLQGEGRVLVLIDPEGDAADSTALVTALRQSNRLIDVASAYTCPNDALSLLPYDSVVLVNVPADALDASQQQALHDGVYNLGVGLLMVGGKNSFGPGGWHHTPVEDALPVSMDITQRKIMPKGALAIILHTCEFGDGNTWAKRITKQAIKVLGARDEVGAINYDGNGIDKWIFPMTPAGDYEKIAPLIESASPADMPSFVGTMTMAYQGLMASDAATKHLIIISDGDPSPPPPNLIEQFITAKISVSVVTVFPHGDQEVPGFRAIANATGGRAYYPQNSSRLPAIFVKEAKTLKRSQIQNITFTASAGFPSPILKGIDAIPALTGYVLTTPKARAQTILEGPDAEEEDPVLATWRYGVGASAAFTADLAPNWGKQWVQWDKYQAFVEQLMKAIGRGETRTNLRLVSEAASGNGLITVEDHYATPGFLTLQARVALPGGRDLTVDLNQTAPGRYQGRFPLAGKGRYQVLVAGAGAAGADGEPRQERVAGGFVVAYSDEYLRFRANPQALALIAERTGGRQLTGKETGKELFDVKHEPRASSRPIFDLFLLLLACLLPLDVAARRIQLDWTVIKGLFIRKPQLTASSATMGALLSVKQKSAAQTTAQSKPPAAYIPTTPSTTKAPVKPTAPPPPPAASGSMASRLLEAKRKRQQQDEDKS